VFSTLQPVPQAAFNLLTATIARRLTPQPIKLRADIELTCYTPSGIEAIKKALKAGEKSSTEAVPIKAKLVAPPLYVLSTNATDKVREMPSASCSPLTNSNKVRCRRTSRTCHRIHPSDYREAGRQSHRQDEGEGETSPCFKVSQSHIFFSPKLFRRQTSTILRNLWRKLVARMQKYQEMRTRKRQ
jgi:hypothetical protein